MTSAAGDRLRALTRTAYQAAAGHLDVEPETEAEGRPRRWALAPRAALAATVLLALVAGLVVLRVVLPSPAPVPVPGADAAVRVSAAPAAGVGEPGGAGEPAPGGSGEPEDGGGAGGGPTVLVVHVVGRVARPGLVELRAGARVGDALAAAGGASEDADLTAVNLARPVVDGEQIHVPAPGEPARAAPAARPAEPAAPSVVNLNTATLADLDALPGIGPVLAGRILDWRAEHGAFTLVEELGEVAGIGPALLERLNDLVTL
jgi:competence protein ComEA